MHRLFVFKGNTDWNQKGYKKYLFFFKKELSMPKKGAISPKDF